MTEAAGIDTTFLVQLEVAEHPGHARARRLLERQIDAGGALALAPQVLAEFVHVVTDGKRFTRPLAMAAALARAEQWWSAEEVRQVFLTPEGTALVLQWMRTHRLGRKRLLDTQLAATYHVAGVRRVLSTNARDFDVFGCFEVLSA
jgi:predicted nucleic acid-binding protein